MLLNYKQENDKLYYSYFTNNKFNTSVINLAEADLFNWKKSKTKTEFNGWDNSYVSKKATKKLSKFRIYEILNSKDIYTTNIINQKAYIDINLDDGIKCYITYNNQRVLLTTNKDIPITSDVKRLLIKNKTHLGQFLYKYHKKHNLIYFSWNKSNISYLQDCINLYTNKDIFTYILQDYQFMYDNYEKNKILIKTSNEIAHIYTELFNKKFKEKGVFANLIMLGLIEENLHLFEIIQKIVVVSRVELIKYHSNNSISEKIMFDKFISNNKFLYDVNTKQSKSYKGGYTKLHYPGQYTNVHYLDYRAMYPTIAMQFNISPETKTTKLHKNKTVTSNGNYFSKDNKGILCIAFEELLNERMIAQTNKDHSLEQSIKIVMNALYGCFGSNYFYFCDYSIAETFTHLGRELIQLSNKYLNNVLLKNYNHKNSVLYNDTDSIFLNLPKNKSSKLLDKLLNGLTKYLDKYATKHNTKNQHILKVEHFFDKLLLVKKKNYCYLKNDKLGITGLKSIHKTTSNFARTKFNAFLTDLLNNKLNTNTDVIKLLKSDLKLFKLQNLNEVSENITINNYENKVYDDYHDLQVKKDAPEWIIGSAYYNYTINKKKLFKYKRIKSGDKVRYYNTTNKSIKTFSYYGDIIPHEFKLECDYDKQFNTSYLNIVNNLLGSIKREQIPINLIY